MNIGGIEAITEEDNFESERWDTALKYEATVVGVNYIKHNNEKIEIYGIKIKDLQRNTDWTVNRLGSQMFTLSRDLKQKLGLDLPIDPAFSLMGKNEKQAFI